LDGLEILPVLFLAVAIDLALGEPPNLFHPVAWMGKVTSFLVKACISQRPLVQFVWGAGITLVIIGLFTAPVFFLFYYLKSLSFVAYVIAGALLLKLTFSLRGLRRAALDVKKLLLKRSLAEARYALRSLVSRNTGDLTESLVVSATVESVAENTCDSFVAPLFYYLLFGVSGAVAYRVVNTMDTMIGYHGEYEYLGKFASRLDDVLNFIPARLTALLLVLAAFLLRRDAKMSWRVVCSDHAKTESPNAGWSMAAVAGALNVQLEKVGHYKLGIADASLVPETIDASVRLMQLAGLAWVVICSITGVIYLVFISQT